jgi:hypothetical protein
MLPIFTLPMVRLGGEIASCPGEGGAVDVAATVPVPETVRLRVEETVFDAIPSGAFQPRWLPWLTDVNETAFARKIVAVRVPLAEGEKITSNVAL